MTSPPKKIPKSWAKEALSFPSKQKEVEKEMRRKEIRPQLMTNNSLDSSVVMVVMVVMILMMIR